MGGPQKPNASESCALQANTGPKQPHNLPTHPKLKTSLVLTCVSSVAKSPRRLCM